jgi:hypothetical protein
MVVTVIGRAHPQVEARLSSCSLKMSAEDCGAFLAMRQFQNVCVGNPAEDH